MERLIYYLDRKKNKIVNDCTKYSNEIGRLSRNCNSVTESCRKSEYWGNKSVFATDIFRVSPKSTIGIVHPFLKNEI